MALVVWIVCGLFSMIGAYCYAELGCLIKKSGGDYAYILDTFGSFIGFIRLWAECLVVRPCTITIVALTFSTYAAKPFFPECEPPDEAIRILAAVCICKFCYVFICILGLCRLCIIKVWKEHSKTFSWNALSPWKERYTYLVLQNIDCCLYLYF